mgnify:CR=1 FL=1
MTGVQTCALPILPDIDHMHAAHQVEAVLDEPSPHEQLADPWREVRVQAVRPVNVSGVHDEMIEPSHFHEAAPPRIESLQYDERPQSSFQRTVEERAVSGR